MVFVGIAQRDAVQVTPANRNHNVQFVLDPSWEREPSRCRSRSMGVCPPRFPSRCARTSVLSLIRFDILWGGQFVPAVAR
jgi:hypothetical protein